MSEREVLADEINYNNAVLSGLDPNSQEYKDLVNLRDATIIDWRKRTGGDNTYEKSTDGTGGGCP
jgi:hypothetical protein